MNVESRGYSREIIPIPRIIVNSVVRTGVLPLDSRMARSKSGYNVIFFADGQRVVLMFK